MALHTIVGLGFLAVTVLGIVLLVFAFRSKRRKVVFGCAAIPCLALGLPAMITPMRVTVWDGSYPCAEYRITFIDTSGKPIEGVQLRVENPEGLNFFLFPISDYLPGQVPVSDRNGRMVFHHCPDKVIFSGRIYYLWGDIVLDSVRGPRFTCRFLRNGKEVHRMDYSELAFWEGRWDTIPHVKYRWKRSGWPIYEILREQNSAEFDYGTRLARFFDLNGDGELGPDEGPAYRAAREFENEEAALARFHGKDPPEEEVELGLIEKTVVIQPEKD
jgi:hypothetical protein